MHKIGHWGGIKEPDKCQKCVPEWYLISVSDSRMATNWRKSAPSQRKLCIPQMGYDC